MLFPKKHRLPMLVLTFVLVASVLGAVSNLHAEETAVLRIPAGETFEVGTDTPSTKAQFSWILTKDRKFISAQRTRFFQTRIAEAGTYVLDVSVQDPTTNQNGYYAFTIIITEPTGTPNIPGDKTLPLAAILRTDPAVINGGVYVPVLGGIVKIDASGSQGDIKSYQIDLDTSADSDEDGNPANDVDNRDSFSEKSGTPLYIFMIPKQSNRTVKLTVNNLAAAAPASTELPIFFANAPVVIGSSGSGSTAPNPNSPVRMERENLEVRFTTTIGAEQAGKQLLYEWSFGDGAKSLLTNPVHTYGAGGVYTIGIIVRDITNGQEIYSGTDTLVIEQTGIPSSSNSASSVVTSSSSSTSGGSTGASLWGIFQVTLIILFLLALAIGLYLLLTWLKKKTATGLQQTLEKMEGTIVQKDKDITAVKAEPMKLKKETPKTVDVGQQIISDREQSKPEFKKDRADSAPVASASGPVPSWLAKANTAPSAAPTTPPPATPKPTPAPAPAPKPQPQPQAPASSNGPVPSWLKPASPATAPIPAPKAASDVAPPAPKPAAPAPQPKPAPVAAPAPAPTVAPAPAPKPAPAPAPTPAPTPAAPKPAPAPTPAPKAEVKPTPAPAAPPPAPTPKPEVKAPAPATPQPKPAPAPVAPPAPSPKPVAPAQPSKPMDIPQAAPKTAPKKPDDSDEPIAIIQADSLTK